jgi:hypothetical protein
MHPALAAEFAAVFSAAAAARWFIAVMAALAMVGGAIALMLPVPHAAWLPTAALRVMKPLHGDTLRRLRQRFVGTAACAVFAVGLLAWPLPAPLRAGIFGVMLTIMHLVGAQRYPRLRRVSPRLLASPFQRAVPITPADRTAACLDYFAVHTAFPAFRPGRHPHYGFRGLLRLHSRYGPLDCSTARSGLRHEASARPIARPSRSSATRSIDYSLGGTLLRW